VRLTARLAAAFLAAAALAEPAEIRARFIGNMAFQLSDGRATLRSDFPYESGYSGYMTWTDALVPPATADTLCLITHSHRDHFLAPLAARFCAKVLGPADVAKALPDRALPLAAEVRFGPLLIRPVATPHAKLEHCSYLVEWSGLRFYFTGDTDDVEALLRQRGLDAAFVSPWLLRMAANSGRRIDARRVVVYHHEAGESVPEIQARELPRQGDELVFRKE
jgi:L-ascorbate metabolism protein UlaG (beta-lactamase superfamily)